MALSKIKKLILVEDAGAMIPAAGATCYVYHATTLTLAQMYTDRNGSVLASNPATIGSTGYLDRYIESGVYDLRVVSGLDETTYPDFLAVDDIIISGPSGELQFYDIANLKAATPLNQKSYKVNWASQLGRKVSTVVNNTLSNSGGKNYTIVNVNPGNLTTLEGGVWVGANHDLGGGFYAKIDIDDDLTIEGFGSTGGVNDDSAALQSLMNYANTFGTVTIADKRSILVKPQLRVGGVTFDHVNIIGNDNVLKAAAGASYILQHEASGDWDYCEIKSLKLDGNSKTSNGLTFLNPYGGRIVFDKFRALNCDIAIYKDKGNIGNTYRDISISYCNYGLFCTSVNSPVLMHSGCDSFYHGHFSNCANAAVYIDSPASGTGQYLFDGTIFEYNQGFGIFVENFLGAGNPFVLNNVWFEGNHTSPSVTIRGVSYTPRDLYLKNVSQGRIYGVVINSVEIISSDLVFEQCKTFGSQYFSMLNAQVVFYRCVVTAAMTAVNSTVTAFDANVGVGVIKAVNILSAYVLRDGSIFYSSNPLIPTHSKSDVAGGTYKISFDGNVNSATNVLDFSGGKTYAACNTGTASGTGRVDEYPIPVVANELYYIKCEIRLNSTDIPIMEIKNTGGVISTDFSALLVKDQWVTVHALGRASNNGTVNFWCSANGGNISLSFGACTVVKVTNVQRINEFFNSGLHIAENPMAQAYSSVIPATAINMVAGSYCKKSSPTVGANNMILDGWRYDGAVWQPQYISTVSPAV